MSAQEPAVAVPQERELVEEGPSAEPRRSDLSRAFSEDGALKTHVGGQALIEGIMMRGRYNWSVAVREPDGGIYVEEHDLASGRAGRGWLHWPLVRGCRALVESLVLGFKALEVAAEHAFSDEETTDGSASDDAGGASETPRSAAQDPSDPSCAALFPLEENKDGVQRVSEAPPASSDAPARQNPPGGALAAGCDVEESASGSLAEERKPFSWKDDFGRPDTMMDALGAQTSLEVISESHVAGNVSEAACGASDCGESAAKRASARERCLEPQDGVPQAAAASSGPDGAAAPSEQGFGKGAMAFSMALGLVLGVVLFIVAPACITNLVVGEYDQNTVLWNIVDGLLRVAVFVFYLWLIGRMSEIKRMFAYHGAEHKTIHCYEHGLPLTPENARSFPRLHVRCGTAFLIMVMVIAIIVYTVTPVNGLIEAWGVPDGAPKLALVILVRILLMPVIAGISYEITVKWAGSHPENPLVKVVLWPGMQMQYLTTNEPDDSMIECAIAAMQRVLEREEAEAAKASGAVPGEAEATIAA